HLLDRRLGLRRRDRRQGARAVRGQPALDAPDQVIDGVLGAQRGHVLAVALDRLVALAGSGEATTATDQRLLAALDLSLGLAFDCVVRFRAVPRAATRSEQGHEHELHSLYLRIHRSLLGSGRAGLAAARSVQGEKRKRVLIPDMLPDFDLFFATKELSQ